MNEQRPKKKSYGLWLKKSDKGTQYATGYIVVNGTKYRVYLFKNERKTQEKQPDYSIMV